MTRRGLLSQLRLTLDTAPATPVRLHPAKDGTYDYTPGAFSRNGLVQCPEIDYIVVNGRLTPTEPWSPTDLIIHL